MPEKGAAPGANIIGVKVLGRGVSRGRIAQGKSCPIKLELPFREFELTVCSH